MAGVYWQVIFPQHVELALCLGRAALTLSEPGCKAKSDFLPWCPPPLLTPHTAMPREADIAFPAKTLISF